MWLVLVAYVIFKLLPSGLGQYITELTPLDNNFEDPYGSPTPAYDYRIDIVCPEPLSKLQLDPLPPQNTDKRIHLNISSCTLPDMPFRRVFELLGLNPDSVIRFSLTDSAISTSGENYTANLTIHHLDLINVTNFHVQEEFFDKLTKLRHLFISKMEVPPLPPSSSFPLEVLTIVQAKASNWDNCENLKKLKMVGLTKDQIPKKWPDNCIQLDSLQLEAVTPEAVDYLEASMSEITLFNLESFSVRNCSLTTLPIHLIQNSQNLKNLDLSNNLLDHFSKSSQFPTLQRLEVLNLSNNKLIGTFLIDIIPKLPSLRELNLNGNNFFAELYQYDSRMALTKLKFLNKLSLNGLPKTWEYYNFQQIHFQSLSYFSWTHPQQQNYHQPNQRILRLTALPSTSASQLEVDLRGYSFKFVSIEPTFLESFSEVDPSQFWLTNKGYKLIVRLDGVDCDCKNDVLARALRDFPHFLSMPDLKCIGKDTLFLDEPMDKLSCRKAIVNGCERTMSRQSDYTTIVDCSHISNNFLWPRPRGFQGFNASGNHIASLRNAYLPDTLEWLDLRNNNITQLDTQELGQLFGSKARRLWLSGNPIICDCGNRPFIEALKRNQSLIVDYDILMCADTGQPLQLVSIDELCRVGLELVWATVSVVVVLVAVAALMMRHYWTTLRMVLYARGYCLSCLREEDLDADRPFDAFLSFSHEDNEYVMQQLLPTLESEPNYYRICVHHRNWLVGEWIPAQIMHSVRASKRTIIVLSKNFVRSWWGALEFRYATASALAEGRSRLLVLVLDDVLSEELSPELKGYLSNNTYLQVDDPWFWDKLRYAMPHVTDRRKSKAPVDAESPAQEDTHSLQAFSMDIIQSNDHDT